MSETLERAYRLLLEAREARGIENYGETLDTSKVDVREYLIEEMADALMYAARIIRDLRRKMWTPDAYGLQPGESLVVEAITMSGERRRLF